MRLLLLGSGELGREVALEAARLGVDVVAADRYDDAPAMAVSRERRVLDMADPAALRALLEQVRPDVVVPELEALATAELLGWEAAGHRVVPTARAVALTMDREGIRRFAAEELGLRTSAYRFASTQEQYLAAVRAIGLPCVVKPVMSSSGKGQSVLGPGDEPLRAWRYAREAARVVGQAVIVEEFVDFAYEVTLLTVRHVGGTTVCPPIGHHQVDGDYRQSWQPHPMTPAALARAQRVATTVVDGLGGHGVFGVELFVTAEDDVVFSEVSPRPHDTGLVTLLSQRTSEFALHVRAVLGLPVRPDDVAVAAPAASAVILGTQRGTPAYGGLAQALAIEGVAVRIFGKPVSYPGRRLGVALAVAGDLDVARERAQQAADLVTVSVR